MTTESMLTAALAFLVGAVIAYIISLSKVKSLKSEKEKEAQNILKSAENTASEIKRSAKSEAKQIVVDEREVL